MSGTFTGFTEGDLVISVVGDGQSPTGGTSSSAPYGDNQAAPIVLDEVTTTGMAVASLDLPQVTTVNAAGVTEQAISGEYGSSSEGSLELAANGQSLVIGGYGVSAAAFDAPGASAIYGTAALAQTTSVQGGPDLAVARVVADIGANGAIDTSTALYGVFNTNNIRSVATVDGSSFYVSGQGVKGDTTQGVFVARDGANAATAIDTSTDTRTVEIFNGALYVSRDSKQGPTANISSYGPTLPTGATAPTTLAGISQSVTLKPGTGNAINSSTGTVHLSPENFFLANATTLYVADSGNPKQGGLGDGGLQKWSLVGGSWVLDYTLSVGLNLVADTATSGTTGLIGLTGKVVGDEVELYATNATLGDLDQTYLYGIDDALGATTAPADESFTTLVTAASDTIIRGIAFAPSSACFAEGTRLATARGAIAVEALEVGDRMTLADGGEASVTWLGHRRMHGGAVIRFRPHSLPVGPDRDLFVSADHAMFVDGCLVPAGLLVNGSSIVAEPRALVTLHHVELERHAVLLAEGAPAESYLDTGNRTKFTNCPFSYDPVASTGEPCAEMVVAGGRLERIRACLPVMA